MGRLEFLRRPACTATGPGDRTPVVVSPPPAIFSQSAAKSTPSKAPRGVGRIMNLRACEIVLALDAHPSPRSCAPRAHFVEAGAEQRPCCSADHLANELLLVPCAGNGGVATLVVVAAKSGLGKVGGGRQANGRRVRWLRVRCALNRVGGRGRALEARGRNGGRGRAASCMNGGRQDDWRQRRRRGALRGERVVRGGICW